MVRFGSRFSSVRVRVIAAVLGLTGLALLVAGAVLAAQARALAEQRVAAVLDRTFDILSGVAAEPDPLTGEPFADLERLLQVAMQRVPYGPGVGALAYLDGELWWTAPGNVEFRPETNDALLIEIAHATLLSATTSGRFASGGGIYRYFVAPIWFSADSSFLNYDDGAPEPSQREGLGRGDDGAHDGAHDGANDGGIAPYPEIEVGALVQIFDMGQELAPLRALLFRYVIGGLGVLTLAGMGIWVLVGRLLAPITLLADTAGRITETDLASRVPITGNDEMARMSAAVNSMLDRVQVAVGAQRELLDDVGHELRTPLTVIRGNLEVMDPADPADVAATRALVLDEVDRTGRLVEDLLVLADAGQADFIRPEPVDITAFTEQTFAKAEALGDRQWELAAAAKGDASLDPQRTAQAWLQLASNAVQYSAPGSVVELGSRRFGGWVEFWVRDHGIGMGPEELAAVEQRSVRGVRATRLFRAGATPHQGGTGLGLAIVSSIIAAQGGRLIVESEVGTGSTFTIRLPSGGLEGKR